MSKAINMIGFRYGKLTVIGGNGVNKYHEKMWVCQCDCGKTTIVRGTALRNGHTTSCGCVKVMQTVVANTKHGFCSREQKRHPLYGVYSSIKERCHNPQCRDYKNYGARGISVCDAWLNDFCSFYEWAITNGYERGLTIDRTNNSGNYCPENCKWVSKKVQANNTRRNKRISFNGKTKTLQEWAEETGLNSNTIAKRIKSGWSVEKAITTPVSKNQDVKRGRSIQCGDAFDLRHPDWTIGY